MAANTCLQFADGNVEIYFSEIDDKYVLHSHVLALHSSWFKACLSDRWNTNGEATTVNGKNYWTFELRFEKDNGTGMLMRRTSTSADETEMISGCEKEMPKGANKATKTAVALQNKRILSIKAHQDMLGALYHVTPSCTKQAYAYQSLEHLTAFARTAGMYGCEAVVKLPVEKHLYENRDKVLRNCTQNPVGMLALALALKINWVFMEASTNILCSAKIAWGNAQVALTKLGVQALFKHKRSEFITRFKDCEFKLLKMTISSDQTSSQMRFMAINYFRQWLTDKFMNDLGSGLGNGYAHPYRQIRLWNRSEVIDDATRGRIIAHFNQMGKTLNTTDATKVAVEVKVAKKADIIVDQLLERQNRTADVGCSIILTFDFHEARGKRTPLDERPRVTRVDEKRNRVSIAFVGCFGTRLILPTAIRYDIITRLAMHPEEVQLANEPYLRGNSDAGTDFDGLGT